MPIEKNMQIRKYFPLILLSCLYVGLVATNIFSGHHQLFNLEPYPDGLLYTLSARNFSQGKGLQLVYRDTSLSPTIPLLYPIVLIVGYVIWNAPQFFYATNVLLGLASLVVLFFLVKRNTGSVLAATISSFAYL